MSNFSPHPAIAQDLMSANISILAADIPIAIAITYFPAQTHLVIVDGQGHVLGVLSQQDATIAHHHGLGSAPVRNHLRPDWQAIAPDTPLTQLTTILITENLSNFVVMNDGLPVGVVPRSAIASAPQTIADFPAPQDHFHPHTWQVLQHIAQAAQDRGWQLYLVGGVVRDLWRTVLEPDLQPAFKDIDLVVDGCANGDRAGVELAQAVQQLYPEAQLNVYGNFQTAALNWDAAAPCGALGIDIATARTETYAYPAANPDVTPSAIERDLYRRDFTVNAMAYCLTAPQAGRVLDFFGGQLDGRSRHLRVMHPNSFIEDPTRIFRGVRFAVRFGFRFEPATEVWLRDAIASGIYGRSLADHPRAPALTTRLKTELKTTFSASYWRPAVEYLTDLEAWRCLHPHLVVTPEIWQQLQRLQRGLQRFDPEQTFSHWQLCLALILKQLPTGDAGQVARNLQLSEATLKRLQQFPTVYGELSRQLQPETPPSAIASHLQPHSVPLLVLLLMTVPRPQRRQIWRYLTHWSPVKPPLNGNDLFALGYPRGPQYRTLLNAVRDATLDGNIQTREDAIAYLQAQYPPETEAR